MTLTIVCIPLGGSLAGFVGGQILPRFGWRALFLIGGIVPLVLAAVLLKVLPESPRYLARLKERWPELRALLKRLGHDVPADAVFIDGLEKVAARRASVGQLLAPEYRRDTLALCGSFFFCLLSVYMGTNWVPSMLNAHRVRHRHRELRSHGLQLRRRRRRDHRRGRHHAPRIADLDADDGRRRDCRRGRAGDHADRPAGKRLLVFAMLAWTGGLINAVQTTMYALAAHVYPTSIRATGVGTAVAFGRIGGVISPTLGSWALESGGSSAFFGLTAATMTAAFVALAAVRRHIPGASPRCDGAGRRGAGWTLTLAGRVNPKTVGPGD